MARWTWREIVVSRRRCRRCRRLSLVEKSIQLHETRTRECKRDSKHRVRECKREKNKKKKSFYLTRFVCVRVRLQLCACCCVCVCIREETTLYDKNYKVFAASRRVVASANVPPLPPLSHTEPTLQMRSSHDYTTVCVCVCAPAIVLVCSHVAALQIWLHRRRRWSRTNAKLVWFLLLIILLLVALSQSLPAAAAALAY